LAKQARSGARRGGNPALRLAAIRRWHSYLGAFIAPSVLFFALTGSLQLFTLHESHDGYHPPAVIEKLGMLHKDQVWELKPSKKPPPPGAAKPAEAPKPAKAPEPAKAPPYAQWALKCVFAVVAASLVVSTCLGLWMALAYSANRRTLWILFLLGAVMPVAILLA
jgi:hypothetical protein